MSKDDYAKAIIREGQRRGITPRGIVIGLATALVESNLIMYANAGDPDSLNYPHEALSRDANSVGLFQQRAPWWGTVADRMDATRSAGLFFEALAHTDYNNGPHSPGSYAQQVQRSAYPDRYDQRMGEAQGYYNRLVGMTAVNDEVSMVARPQFTELDYMTGGGRSNRSQPPINFLLHTEEGGSSAVNLAQYCNGSHDVSYHYTLRDGILCDVVDTDYASWSVLDANAYTINLCFAGSRASWSRADWLTRERDIEIAAFIAVQDCKKYNIPTDVIAPPYRRANGISDHRYVTNVLGIGTHTDVGNGFPWDVFSNYVAKHSGGSYNDEENMAWGEVIKNLNGQPVSREDMIKYMDARLERMERIVIAIADQVAGAGVGEAVGKGEAAKFDGFKQGGNRSAYDLQSAIAAALKVPGATDLKAGK